jgi:hypothetical protein
MQPGLPQPFAETILIEDNLIADDVTVRNNEIRGNDSFGIAITGNFNVLLDPRTEPFNDDIVVRDNDFSGNGTMPDPLRSFTPGADIIVLPDVFNPGTGALLLVDPDPSDICLDGNVFDTDFPPGIVSAFPCP